MDIIDSLLDWELFSHFTAVQAEELLLCLDRQRLAAGKKIIKEGDSGEEAFFIESGEIRIQRSTPYGPYHLATLRPGELFGEASFLDHLARSGDAVTVDETELIVFDPAALATVMERDQALTIALLWTFWKSLSRKLRMSNDHLTGFFGSGGPTPPSQEPAPGSRSGSFQVGLAEKRQLFQEQKLSSMEINFLSSLSKERKLGEGEVLFHEGDQGDRMYVVLEGQVRISKIIPGAGEEALAFLERGDYFGEMALIDNQPRSADARVHTGGAVVLEIPRDVLEGILDIRSKVSSPRLLRILCSLVATRLREIDEKIVGWFMLSGGQVGRRVQEG